MLHLYYYNYVNAADFGAFTWLPYTTPQRLKNKMGFYAYVLDGIKDLAKLQSEHLRITINDQTQEREQNLNNELISFCRTDRIEVECMKKLAWALDGEKCVGGSRHALEMLPRRVRIVY